MSMLEGKSEDEHPNMLCVLLRDDGNTFQKRRVSSPAPVTIACPSGLMLK